MRPTPLFRLAVGGLWRQKARTALTVLGVAVGAGGLAFSVALGLGLRGFIDREFRGRPAFWTVHVQPGRGKPVPEADIPPAELEVKGEMSAERRARLRAWRVEQYQAQHRLGPPAKLTPDRLAGLAALPGVEGVEAWYQSYGEVRAGPDRKRGTGQVVGGPLDGLQKRLVAGRLPAGDADEAVASERLLYALGLEDEAAVTAAFGKPLALTLGGGPSKGLGVGTALGLALGDVTELQEHVLSRAAAVLPKAIDHLDLTPVEKQLLTRLLGESAARQTKAKPAAPATAAPALVGVVRDLSEAEKYEPDSPDPWELRTGDVFLSVAAGERLFGQLDWVAERGYNAARVRVVPGGDLKAVVDAVEADGFNTFHLLKFYQATKTQVTLTAAGLNVFALLALVVAALGIANTLVTSVVERTREIGMMKAVGATGGQVRRLFLLEGAVTGLAGGLLGVVGAWAASGPGDRLVRHLIASVSPETPRSGGPMFDWPLWLPLAAAGFAAATTTLAAWYPARRAARLDPVAALRG